MTVDLATGKGTGGYAQGDILIGIETVYGGKAGNTLTGDSGGDRFVFATTGDSVTGANADRITDFSRAQGDRSEA